jgi:hypothetical protein
MYPSYAVSKIMLDHYIMFYNCASYFKMETLYRGGKKATLLHGENKIQNSFINKINLNLCTNSTPKHDKIMLHMTDEEVIYVTRIRVICVLFATQEKGIDPARHKSLAIGF